MLKYLGGRQRAADIKTQSVDFSGIWRNDLGSEMDLSINGGLATGTYRTAVGAPKPTEQFDLAGFVLDDLICFTVSYASYGSLAAWVGQHTVDAAGIERIETLWHLVRNVPDPDEPGQLWSGVLSGANTFTR